mmetsp:Transcript_14289/g.20287  ORF Transcript_14289/g.20287 Transcript_14289/m.20287 type:complete len:259 (-) Transcript_14289:92-868(-)
MSHGRVETLPIRGSHGRFIQGGTKRVQGNVNRIGIGTNLEKISHNHGSLPTQRLDKLGKVLNPILDQGRFNNFNLHLLQHIGNLTPITTLLQKLGKVRSHRSIHQHSLIQILISTGSTLKGGNGPHGTFLEHAEGVALSDEFVNVTAGECALEEEHDVFNHVFVGDKVDKGGEGFDCLGTEVFDFGYQLLHSSLLQPRRNQSIHILQSLHIIRLTQIQPHIIQRFALGQMMIIGIDQKGGSHATNECFGESVEDVECG